MPSTRNVSRHHTPKPIIGLPVTYQMRLDDVKAHDGDVEAFKRGFGGPELAPQERPGEFPKCSSGGDSELFERLFSTTVGGTPYFTPGRLNQAISEVGRVVGSDSYPHVDLLGNLPPEVRQAFKQAGVTVFGCHENKFKVGSFKGGQYAPTFYDNLDWLNRDRSVKGIMFSSGNAIQGVLYMASKLMEQGVLRDDFNVIMVAYPGLSPAKRKKIDAFNEAKPGIVEVRDAREVLAEFKALASEGDFDEFRDQMRATDSKHMVCEGSSFTKPWQSLDPNDLDDLHVMLEYYSWRNNLFHTPYSNTPGTILGGGVMYHRIKEGIVSCGIPDSSNMLETTSHTTGRTGVAPDMIFMGLGGGSPGVGLAMAALFDGDDHTTIVGCMPADRPITFIADSYKIPMIQSWGTLALKAFGTDRFQMADVLEDDIVRAFVDLNDSNYHVEPSGAIPLALLYSLARDPAGREKIRGKSVGLVLSGANYAHETLDLAKVYYNQHDLGRIDYFMGAKGI